MDLLNLPKKQQRHLGRARRQARNASKAHPDETYLVCFDHFEECEHRRWFACRASAWHEGEPWQILEVYENGAAVS